MTLRSDRPFLFPLLPPCLLTPLHLLHPLSPKTPQSMMTFEGNGVQGAQAIVEKIKSFGQIQHSVKTTGEFANVVAKRRSATAVVTVVYFELAVV